MTKTQIKVEVYHLAFGKSVFVEQEKDLELMLAAGFEAGKKLITTPATEPSGKCRKGWLVVCVGRF